MTRILWSRKCKRCHGQLFFESNFDGQYLVCLQCGHYEIVSGNELVEPVHSL